MIDGVGETRWGLMVVVGGRENCSDLLSEVDYCDLFIILIYFSLSFSCQSKHFSF